MVGDWIQLSEPTGDGYWYQIATVTPPNVATLNILYNGSTIVNGAASYTIGEMSPIPEGYEDIIEEDVLARHYRRLQDMDTATVHQQIADSRFEDLINDTSSKVANPYSAPQIDITIPNINSFPTNLTGF
jgi:hypothetical protein